MRVDEIEMECIISKKCIYMMNLKPLDMICIPHSLKLMCSVRIKDASLVPCHLRVQINVTCDPVADLRGGGGGRTPPIFGKSSIYFYESCKIQQ